ncbi:MAG TPA: cytochrome c biogenesis protein CcsA [Opitutaceae bacterium]|jgi:ABC-type transport system involved in cytochrome c biogenesis permease subunit|nr:cytochrome c biogenesis protein CcsA [Opitutaceae bacterium]
MKRFLPLIVLLLALAGVAASLFPPRPDSEFDLNGFAHLPVLADGRLKPIDTVARTSLLELQGKQDFTAPDGRILTPIEWLLDVFYRADVADKYQHFRIDNLDVLALFNLQPEDGADKKLFSFEQLKSKLPELERQATLASQVENAQQSTFERAVIKLQTGVLLYQRLKYSLVMPDSEDFLAELLKFQDGLAAGIEAVRAKEAGKPHDEAAASLVIDAGRRFDFIADATSLLTIPPEPGDPKPDDWQNMGHALLGSFADGRVNPDALAFAALGHAWRFHQPEQFNELVKLYRAQLEKRFAPALKKCDFEAHFNAAQPFYTAMIIYVLAFVLAISSWLKWPDALGRSAFYLVAVAFALATAGILARMWLEGRPPVTNLYSSALFIGWGAVGLCLILEKLYRNAIGSVAAGLIGFGTLLIAHHLALGGDTMEMMRAVLDSNFWLSTHVVVVATGYASTFLAGILAIIYIFRGLFTRSLDKATADALARMVYGIVCFATLFSFVGTILGGIWADQSWGRFWGWDPKENGALIIVLWNALILHARWGGLVKQRGLMCLAVFGNIVTSWSWFGVNMLGVGLHSYGFTQATFWWLIGFIATQLIIIGLASLPLEKWRSFRAPGA